MDEIRVDRYGNLASVPAFLDEVDDAESEFIRLGPSILAVALGTVILFAIGVLAVVAIEAALDAHSLANFVQIFATDAVDPFFEEDSLADDARYAVQTGVGFGLAAIGVPFLLGKINGRPALTYLTAAARFRWPLAAAGFVIFGTIVAIACAVGAVIAPDHYVLPLFDAREPLWLRLSYLAALVVFTAPKIALEEIVTRGWLLQTSYAFAGHIIPILAVNGLLFSMLRAGGDTAAIVAYLGAAFVWSWTAIRLGGLEFGIGARTANIILLGALSFPVNAEFPAYTWTDMALRLGPSLAVLIAVEIVARAPKLRRLAGAEIPAGC